ncbi:MAG: C4-dicarboxylate ABC transporter [Candidatus Krumholzibacteria bacterium]|nr:C4-dicarboxylate ABC transporter [Candidatus Krumholzibacteria bacterium]
MRILNVAVRAMFIVIGIFLIVGLFKLRNMAPEVRIIMGAVLILYGAFRIVTLFMPKRSGDRQ